MTDAPPPAPQELPAAYERGGKRRGRVRKRHTVAKVLLSTVLVLGLVTGLGVAFLYRHLNGNLDVQVLDDQIAGNRPEEVDAAGPSQPINILVMGSDTREGEGNAIDGENAGPGLSDTTILMHLSADRKSAYGISIPRDTLVERPDCLDEDGETIPGSTQAQWNAAFALGGPACTITQVEQLTGIRVNNYVVVDFSGFRGMVDAIDGVDVCIPDDIDDPARNIQLDAGTRKLYGEEALTYVRARYRIGDGSDIGRIQRQQAFVSAMVEKVVSGGTLARVDRLVGFLNAATASLQTDIENIGRLARIGYEFRDVGLNRIQFITAPFQYSESQPGRVEFLPEADELWEKVVNDAPLGSFRDKAITAGNVPGVGASTPGSGTGSPNGSPSGSPSAPDSATPSPTDDPTDEATDEATEDERAEELAAAGLCT